MTAAEMKIKAIAPWFGSKRTMAPEIAKELGSHRAYWEPFCGSMAVLFAKKPSGHEHVNDLHGDLINLARVIQADTLGLKFYRRMRRVLCHEKVFSEARDRWLAYGDDADPLDRACDYFLMSWLGRNGVSGTQQYNYQFAVRWTSRGGHGGVRFANAVGSIPGWRRRLARVTILQRDAFDILEKIDDQAGTAIYVDPPYFRDGTARSGSSRYVHEFDAPDHKRLAEILERFSKARVVVSYYDNPSLATLYPQPRWITRNMERQKHLATQNARGPKRCTAPEVLLLNGPSLVEESSDGRLF